MNTSHILQQAQTHEQTIARLRLLAPNHPEVYTEETPSVVYVTSMVEFTYNEVVFRRHHVESIIPCDYAGKDELVERLMAQAELTKLAAIPCHLDEIIGPVLKKIST